MLWKQKGVRLLKRVCTCVCVCACVRACLLACVCIVKVNIHVRLNSNADSGYIGMCGIIALPGRQECSPEGKKKRSIGIKGVNVLIRLF